MSALITMTNATCAYGRVEVLSDASLAIDTEDFVGIVGPSGAGKTTLLKVLLGTMPVVAGSVMRAPNVRVGYVPQVDSINWYFPVTVREVVAMASPRTNAPWISRREAAAINSLLEDLELEGLAKRHIRDLSGGQQQRVFIARALYQDPDVLLLDEPTSGVDVRTRHEVLHLLAALNTRGIAVVLTTHDLNGIAAHLPQLVCVNRWIIAAGSPREVITPSVLEATFGAPMAVLEHAGMPIVVDGYHGVHATTTKRAFA